MTPKEKAKELFDKYEDYVRVYNDDTPRTDMQKQCALIAVDEILNNDNAFIQTNLQNNYWKDVKQEIEKL